MKFGVYLTMAQYPDHTQQEVFEDTLRYVGRAEELGFSDAWVFEHHFTKFSLCNSPLTMAGFLLGRTTRLRIGTSITVLPIYHPIRLAEQVALLDHASRGRFLFGIGRGTCKPDFDFFGVDMGKTHLMMPDYMDTIERAWRNDAVESKGEFVQFPMVPVYPTPFTQPAPPVYVAAESPRTTEWAAAQGYPLLLNHYIEEEAMVSQLELYREVSAEHGYDPDEKGHIFSCIAYVAATREAAQAAVRDNFAWWRRIGIAISYKFEELRHTEGYEFQFRRWEDQIIKAGGNADDGFDSSLQHLLDINPVGTVDHCVERLCRVTERTGIRHVVCGFEGAASAEKTIEAMERFAEEVIPRVRSAVEISTIS